MKKFFAIAFCACLFAPVIAGGANPNPDIHALLTIRNATVAPLTITSGTPPSGRVGVSYGGFHFILGHSFTGFIVSASGGTPPYTWSATGLPAGLALRYYFWGGSTRCCVSVETISGVPTTAGTYHVVLTVTDSENPKVHKSASYTITIAAR